MADGKRPGGLTALAVLNFVFAGLSLLGVLALIVVVAMADRLKSTGHDPQDRAALEAVEHMSMGLWVLLVASAAVATALLITSGIGYLKMRHWGRRIGNVCALLTISVSLAEVVVIPSDLGGGFNIGTIINLVYPLLSLYFLNVTFKDDLTS